MSATANCACPCPTPEVVEVPGSAGADGAAGAAGADGINAYTVTTANVTLPAAAGPVVLATSVAVSSWASIGQVVFISDGTNWGHFEVLTKPSSTSMTLDWLNYPNDAAGTTVIASGATVSPAGVLAAFAPPTALTDNSTGTASNTIAAGVGVMALAFYIDAATIANGDLLTAYTPGFAFKVLKVDARCANPVTTGAKAADINLEIGTTNLTGGVVALAGTYAIGAAQAGTAVTANNTGTAADTVSIEAANVTAFTEGAFWIIVSIQNMDTANAIASLADHVNDLITALT